MGKLIPMTDMLSDDADQPNEVEGIARNLVGKKNANKAALTRKRKAKKRARDSLNEDSSDNSADGTDEEDDDGDDDDDDDDRGGNQRSRIPLPYSAQKVDYVYVSRNVRRAVPRPSRKPRGKKPYARAVPPQDEGKSSSTIVRI